MKNALIRILCLIVLLMGLAPALEAGPQAKSIASVEMDHIAQLENMHQRASDYLIKNNFNGALRAYSDILLLEPDDETAYTGMGQIYMVLGQSKKAHDAFQNALYINPQNEVALAGIQHILDPDGVEGMTSANDLRENAPEPQDLLMVSHVKLIIDPGHKAWAKSEPRMDAQKAKLSKRVRSNIRIGKLHAQRLQMALKNAGIYQGPVNGMYGKDTRRALKDFQKRQGLEVTGTVNTATWNNLSTYLE